MVPIKFIDVNPTDRLLFGFIELAKKKTVSINLLLYQLDFTFEFNAIVNIRHVLKSCKTM